MSDHIFLGASLVAIFTAEAHLIAADIRRRWAGRRRLDRVVLASTAGAVALLFGLMCVEMHITARHFHRAAESGEHIQMQPCMCVQQTCNDPHAGSTGCSCIGDVHFVASCNSRQYVTVGCIACCRAGGARRVGLLSGAHVGIHAAGAEVTALGAGQCAVNSYTSSAVRDPCCTELHVVRCGKAGRKLICQKNCTYLPASCTCCQQCPANPQQHQIAGEH